MVIFKHLLNVSFIIKCFTFILVFSIAIFPDCLVIIFSSNNICIKYAVFFIR